MGDAEATNQGGSAGSVRPPRGTPNPGGFSQSQSWRRTAFEFAVIIAIIGGLIFGLRACAGCAAEPITSALPASVDAAIGRASAEAIRAQHAAAEPPAPEQVARVERIFGELKGALTPEQTRVLVAPRVTVVRDSQVNAFALPGGEVFVLTGLLGRVGDDDDMLRGVLAHELGHSVHRHGVRGLVRSGIYGIVLSYALGDVDGIAAALIAGASKLTELEYSRSMEDEADAFGVDLLERAGKSAEGMARFMESLESAPIPELVSTHPDSKERAKRIRERINKR